MVASFFYPVAYTGIALNAIFLFALVFYFILYLERKDFGKAKYLKHYPSIAVLIPAYNSIRTIEKCLESVKKIKYPRKFEIFVVDDGSTDGTTEVLKKFGGIKLISFGKNCGKAAALNIGLKKIKVDFVACIDSDTYPEEGVFLKMMGYFEEKSMAAVTCLVLPDKKEKIVQKVQFYEYITSFGLWSTVMSSIDSIFVAPGPLTIFRKKIFDVVGYYEEGNLTEDMEMGLRLRRNNYKIGTCFEARVYTDIPDTWQKLFKQRDRWYRGSVSNFVRYKDLFFNRKNPHLGFFTLPYSFAMQLVSIAILLRVLFYIAKDSINFVLVFFNFFSLGGSVVIVFKDFVIPPVLLFFIISNIFVASYAYLSFKMVNYSPPKGDLLAILLVVLVYPYFIILTYSQSFFKEVFGARSSWVRVST
jgi:cellulose synthase/poly-beta-1,6-N-acetylglucosamine synthase-like glycosyltransferase